ncbi:hypothetical protein [Longispora urticae]
MTITVPFQPLPLDQSDVRYAHGPDLFVRPGVPTGRLVQFDWHTSTVYPGTGRAPQAVADLRGGLPDALRWAFAERVEEWPTEDED